MQVRVIRQERIKKGWTIESVAKKIGISKQSMQRLETGENNPSYKVLMKLEDLFGLTHRELFMVTTNEMTNTIIVSSTKKNVNN